MHLVAVPSFPDLPTDVARLIVETVAWDEICTAQSLTYVSKTVRQWIDPILYHTVVIRTRSKLDKFHHSIISRNDPAFFTRHVKILRIGAYNEGRLIDSLNPLPNEMEALDVVLGVCRGLERFALWLPEHNLTVRRDFMGETGCIQPSRLSLLDITTMPDTSPDRFEFWPPSLTHLHMDEESIDDATLPWQKIFISCPKLTHIALSGSAINARLSEDQLLELIEEPLAMLPESVTAFVILLKADSLPLPITVEPLIETSERLVIITHSNEYHGLIPGMHHFDHTFELDWGDGRGMDTWEFADLCIAERKRKRQGS